MMYSINTVEIKTPEWRILSLTGVDGVAYENVSVNRTNQKGETQWPDMGVFEEGKSVDGNVWKSPSNKFFLFPLRERSGAPKGVNIAKAQAVKAENIKEAQDNKSQSIRTAAAMRDCTLIALASLKDQPFPTMDDFDREFTSYLEWYMRKWEKAEKMADKPF